jgi:O-antigen/teichoic acid export membrane protein
VAREPDLGRHPSDPQIAVTDKRLSVADLKRRATSGVFVLGLRGLALRSIGLVGLLVFARVLGPSDFGVVAFGLSVTFFASFLSDGGLGPSLIRRPEPPTLVEYESVVGVQAALTTAVALICGAAAVLSGNRTTIVTALFVASLPLLAFRVPAFTALERELRFGPSVTAEVVETLVYTVWSIAGLLLGFGVYALGTGAIVKTLVGTSVLNAMAPVGWVVPRVRVESVRGLLGFGLKFQGSGAVELARDQLLNLSIAGIAGYATLGVWAAADRVISVPLLVFETLWRVSFPVISRLRDAGEASTRMIRKGVELGAVISCGMLVPVAVVAAPALEGLLGHQWAEAAALMPWLCLGLAMQGSIGIVVASCLLADNAAGRVLACHTAGSVVMLVVALPLLPLVGYWALAAAFVASSVVDAVALDETLNRRLGYRTIDRVGPSVLCGLGAAAVGFAVLAPIGNDVLKVVVGASVSVSAYVLLISLLSRDAGQMVWNLVRDVPRRRGSSVA